MADASSLRPELVAGLDILIVRELTGGIYFGEPRGIESANGRRRGYNTDVYADDEIERIARVAFDLAGKRSGRLTSVDKANVLEVTQLWRDVVTEVHEDFPDVELDHPLRRQRGDATGAGTEAVRCHRHRQSVR